MAYCQGDERQVATHNNLRSIEVLQVGDEKVVTVRRLQDLITMAAQLSYNTSTHV
jgi:hypothetical protein